MNDKIRLLKFLSVFMIGGTERQFVNVVQRLDSSKFDLHLACFKKFGAFLDEIESCGYPLQDFSISHLYSYKTLRAQLRFAGYLRRHRIQVLHTYGLYPNLFAIPAARLAGVPVTIASVRDMGAHATDMKMRMQRWICRMATGVVANADAVRDWLVEQGVAEGKIRVIRNGIVTRELPAGNEPGIRQEFGIPESATIVGSICRLTSVKGVEYLVEAAAAVRSRHPNTWFIVLGDGESKPGLVSLAQQLGLGPHMIFTGFRTDTPRFLRGFDISVLPSLTEGLSNTLMESMAAGLPVVATRVGGTPEVVVDGLSGILVEPRDSGALATSICRLLGDKAAARRIGEAGRARVAEHFSMQRTVLETERLYSELMHCRGGL